LDKRVEYTYDVFDQLIGKTVDDDGDGNADRAEAYVWDRGQILLDFVDDNAGNGLDDFVLARRYLHGPLVDQVLAQENVAAGPGNENVDWLLADHQGTVRDVVRWDDVADEAELVEHYQYDTFGNLTAILDSAGMVISTDRADAVTRYQYTGRDWDADSGLQYNRARWYDPATGRWISEDPIGFAAGDANLARYVGNGATVATDPSGLAGDSVSRSVAQEAARGNVENLRFLLNSGGLNKASQEFAKRAIARLTSRARDIIAKECKGQILREFPKQLLTKKLADIIKLARRGDKAARKALKLLNDNRFKKSAK
jgi:RHS repeat-associated protein